MRTLPFVFVALSAFGCSSSSGPTNAPPVIDAISMPGSATVGADGKYTLSGKISYHDDDDVVKTLRVSAYGSNFDIAVTPTTKAVDATIMVQFLSASKGHVDYEITLIDAGGATVTSKQAADLL